MNKYSSILSFLLLFIAISCQDKEDKNENPELLSNDSPKIQFDSLVLDDYQIINSTLVNIVVPPPPGIEMQFGYDNYDFKKEGKEIPEEMIDSIYFTPFLLTIKDSTGFRAKPFSLNEDLNKIEDSSYINLGKKLTDNQLNWAKIDLNKIENVGLYKLIELNPDETPELEIGDEIISYSRILYNKDKTKALFYFENYCSGLCGAGMIVLMEKEDEIWKIKRVINNWVS